MRNSYRIPYQAITGSPIGKLGIRASSTHLLGLDFLPPDSPISPATQPLAQQAVDQLTGYFRDPNTPFTLPYQLQGSGFQHAVWRTLLAIPPGQTARYGQLAAQLATAPRAVGNACRANPLPLIVPCHRVVGRGHLGGYLGNTKEIAAKVWLLRHEGATC